MKLFPISNPPLASTPFSDFFRKASSSEKKRVYNEVLKGATERQQNIVNQAKGSKR
jgi:hypothetical protein